ncbi:MAG: AgmX/PglI C-terminal domain-containing protein [Myxococcota bacterium]
MLWLMVLQGSALASPWHHALVLERSFRAAADRVVGPEIRIESGDGLGGLILEQTDTVVEAYAGIARVTTHQWFFDPTPAPGQATALMPLPAGAIVDHAEIRCGEQILSAAVVPRRSAHRAGHVLTTSDVFSWTFPAICPDTIQVTVQYVVPLRPEGDTLSLQLPMVPSPSPAAPWEIPLPTPEQRVTVVMDEGMHLEPPQSAAALSVQPCGQQQVVSIEANATDDIRLSWRPTGAALVAHRPDPDAEGILALTVSPEVLGRALQAPPRELLFVLDGSCSMRGAPAAQARDIVEQTLHTLSPSDRFNLIAMHGERPPLFDAPQPFDAAARSEVAAWMASESSTPLGLGDGLLAAVHAPPRPDALRRVLLLSDGHFSDADRIAAYEETLGSAPIDAVGLGLCPDRAALQAWTQQTGGEMLLPRPEETPQELARRMQTALAAPLLSAVSIDWGDLAVLEQYPQRTSEMMADRPLQVLARFGGEIPLNATVRVQGRMGDVPVSLEVPLDLPGHEPQHDGLQSLWALGRIERLSAIPADPEALEAALTAVSVSHQLVTRYTALADDDGMVVQSAAPMIPTEEPVAVAALRWTEEPAVVWTKAPAPPRRPGPLPPVSLSTVGMNIPTGAAADLIRQAMNAYTPEVERCFQEAVARNVRLQGGVTVQLTVEAGAVSQHQLTENTTQDRALGRCVQRRASRWSFPETVSGRLVLPYTRSPGRWGVARMGEK